MKNEFRQVGITLILIFTSTFLFCQVKLIADIPNRDSNDPVYSNVEKMPQLSGTNKIQQYIDYYPYPSCGLDHNIQGKVVLQFIVEKSGKLSDIKVVNSPGQCLSDAAIEYVKQWPLWEPAKFKDKVVSCLFTLPIEYNIEKYNSRPK